MPAEKAAEAATTATTAVNQLPKKDIYEAALNAIDAVTGFASYTLGALAILLGLIALLGWWELRRATVRGASMRAAQVANERMDTYLRADEIGERLTAAIQEHAQRRVAGMIVVTAPAAAAEPPDGGEAFQEAPKEL